jgi:FAD/FMN-containing dehydrogenase
MTEGDERAARPAARLSGGLITIPSGTSQPASAAGLARHLRGRVIGPDSPDWDMARRPWNRRVDQRPLVVADAEGPDDIAATVAHAARHDFQVTVQASGHGPGGSMENAILLRTSGLREITLDPGQRRSGSEPGSAAATC